MAIEVTRLSKSYGDLPVIDDLSFHLPERGVVAVTGRSGSGKTTLLHLLLGLIVPDSGTITGVGRMGAVFQEDRLIRSLSVWGNLKLVSNDLPRIDEHLHKVGLHQHRNDPISALSGGMRRRLAIARAMLYPCDAVAMDEPFKGLDVDTRAEIIDYVLQVCADRLVLLVTHEPEELHRMNPAAVIELKGMEAE